MEAIPFKIEDDLFARVLSAVGKSGYERLEDETDIDYFKRYTNEHFSNLVYAVERAEASNSVRQEETIIE